MSNQTFVNIFFNFVCCTYADYVFSCIACFFCLLIKFVSRSFYKLGRIPVPRLLHEHNHIHYIQIFFIVKPPHTFIKYSYGLMPNFTLITNTIKNNLLFLHSKTIFVVYLFCSLRIFKCFFNINHCTATITNKVRVWGIYSRQKRSCPLITPILKIIPSSLNWERLR